MFIFFGGEISEISPTKLPNLKQIKISRNLNHLLLYCLYREFYLSKHDLNTLKIAINNAIELSKSVKIAMF